MKTPNLQAQRCCRQPPLCLGSPIAAPLPPLHSQGAPRGFPFPGQGAGFAPCWGHRGQWGDARGWRALGAGRQGGNEQEGARCGQRIRAPCLDHELCGSSSSPARPGSLEGVWGGTVLAARAPAPAPGDRLSSPSVALWHGCSGAQRPACSPFSITKPLSCWSHECRAAAASRGVPLGQLATGADPHLPSMLEQHQPSLPGISSLSQGRAPRQCPGHIPKPVELLPLLRQGKGSCSWRPRAGGSWGLKRP